MQKKKTQKKQNNHHRKPQFSTKLRESARVTNHPYLQPQNVIGNHGVLRLCRSDIIQPKVKFSFPKDKYEREANRVAEMVVGTSNHTSLQQVSSIRDSQVQEQTAIPSAAQSSGVPDIVRAVISSGRSRPLDRSTREFMEQSFDDCDFSHVRIHVDGPAAESARAINVRAYTAGRDVVFGAGEYSPETRKGRKLIAHELTHVKQQRAIGPTIQAKSGGRGKTPLPQSESGSDVIQHDDQGRQFISYTVVSGDTLTDIARSYRVDLSSIVELNPQIRPPQYMIRVSDVIKIPISAPTPLDRWEGFLDQIGRQQLLSMGGGDILPVDIGILSAALPILTMDPVSAAWPTQMALGAAVAREALGKTVTLGYQISVGANVPAIGLSAAAGIYASSTGETGLFGNWGFFESTGVDIEFGRTATIVFSEPEEIVAPHDIIGGGVSTVIGGGIQMLFKPGTDEVLGLAFSVYGTLSLVPVEVIESYAPEGARERFEAERATKLQHTERKSAVSSWVFNSAVTGQPMPLQEAKALGVLEYWPEIRAYLQEQGYTGNDVDDWLTQHLMIWVPEAEEAWVLAFYEMQRSLGQWEQAAENRVMLLLLHGTGPPISIREARDLRLVLRWPKIRKEIEKFGVDSRRLDDWWSRQLKVWGGALRGLESTSSAQPGR